MTPWLGETGLRRRRQIHRSAASPILTGESDRPVSPQDGKTSRQRTRESGPHHSFLTARYSAMSTDRLLRAISGRVWVGGLCPEMIGGNNASHVQSRYMAGGSAPIAMDGTTVCRRSRPKRSGRPAETDVESSNETRVRPTRSASTCEHLFPRIHENVTRCSCINRRPRCLRAYGQSREIGRILRQQFHTILRDCRDIAVSETAQPVHVQAGLDGEYLALRECPVQPSIDQG